jgi:predicted nucleic acid-binding protein
MNQAYVLDANAILDLAERGSGARRVDEVLRGVLQQRTLAMVSVLNWGEVFYLSYQRRGEEAARRTLSNLSRLPLEFVGVDLAQALLAGELKARHKIPYVDCIAAALAMQRHAVLVTSDRDFEKLARRVQVLWITRP